MEEHRLEHRLEHRVDGKVFGSKKAAIKKNIEN
jgi:hypothetical protein